MNEFPLYPYETVQTTEGVSVRMQQFPRFYCDQSVASAVIIALSFPMSQASGLFIGFRRDARSRSWHHFTFPDLVVYLGDRRRVSEFTEFMETVPQFPFYVQNKDKAQRNSLRAQY